MDKFHKKVLLIQLVLLVIFAIGGTGCAATHPEGLDWDPHENPDPALPVQIVQNLRDGVLGIPDVFFDMNSALFGEMSLFMAKTMMATSDGVGLVDDNLVTQHVMKSLISKPLAKTAYLWHVAGSEALLGGHEMEVERWAGDTLVAFNPLLSPEDSEEFGSPLPLDPLAFTEDAYFHTDVYLTHSVVLGLGAIVVSDGLLRPTSCVLRIFQLRKASDWLNDAGNGLVRKAAGVGE